MQRKSTLLQKAFYAFAIFMLNSLHLAAQQNNSLQSRITAQPAIDKVVFSREANMPSVIKFREGAVTEKNAVAMIRSVLELPSSVELKASSPVQDKTGVSVTKLQEFYNNIKVEHGVYHMISRGGNAEAISGAYYEMKNINTVPSLNEEQALVFAKSFVHAEKYAWEQAKEARDAETDLLKKALYNQQYQKLLPEGELVIVKDLSQTGILDLAYKFDIYAAAPMTRGYVYVNAHTGKIMLYDRIIKHLSPDQKNNKTLSALIPEVAAIASQAPNSTTSSTFNFQLSTVNSVLTPLPTRYAGTRMVGTKQVSGNDPSGNGLLLMSSTGTPFIPGSAAYVLIDDTHHSQGEETYDLNGAGGLPVSVPVYGTAKSFTDVDNNWTAAEHKRGGQNNEAENDDYAFDAHWGATIVYDYWNNIHGRKSFDNLNSSIKSYVHYGAAYDNAFWNGTVMTYGDGSAQGGLQAGFAPLTSLDVCGHEIGHGVCSFTADLVYQGESGAMNEGFSDVWAACIENYAELNVDATLVAGATNPNGFKTWSIGEQIDANDLVSGSTGPNYPSNDPNSTALRYMDTPNKAGDPAYYAEKPYSGATRRWKVPNCTAPSLANDQCGVHTNSGVLNRLMYVLTMGAAGTVNTLMSENTSGAIDGAPYNVTGLGFARSEKIMYLTEQMLSPNATFLDARNAGVTAAEILYGKCSFEWKQTIIAWNAVAVGASSDTAVCSGLPPFSASVQRNVDEAAAKSSVNCTSSSTDVILTTNILAPGIANPVTITVTPSGTATLNADYSLSATTVNYTANQSGLKKITISVYNDAEIEADENIILAIHAADGAGFTKDTSITVTISDDDNIPVIGSARTNLLSEYFDATATAALPAGWNAIDKLGTSSVNWRVGPAVVPAGFNTKAAIVSLNAAATLPVPVVTPVYDPSAPGNVILSTPKISAKSYNDLRLTFTYAANGEVDGAVPPKPLDYGRLVYSYDGIIFQPFQFTPKLYFLQPTAARDTVLLPPFLNNKEFYIGFEWFNDDNAAIGPSFIVDSVVVSGGRQKIETEAGDAVAEKQFNGKDLYYMSAQDGELIARIRNNTADLGCVTATVIQAGSGASSNIITYGTSTYQRANKVFIVTPSPANTTASYEITLYATAAELSGMPPASLQIMKVKDGVPLTGTISASDAVLGATVFTDHSADGYYSYTASFTGFSQFIIALQAGVVAQNLLRFNAAGMENKYIRVDWSATNETNGNYILERAEKGSNDFASVNAQNMRGGAGVNEYAFNDYNVVPGVVYQYRLRSVENNSARISEIRLASISGKAYHAEITPNPSEGLFNVYVRGATGDAQIAVYDQSGRQLIMRKQRIDANAPFRIDLTGKPSGIYTLKLQTAEGTDAYKLMVK